MGVGTSFKEARQSHIQSAGDFDERSQCWIFFTAFESTNISPMHAAPLRNDSLGQSLSHAQFAHLPSVIETKHNVFGVA